MKKALTRTAAIVPAALALASAAEPTPSVADEGSLVGRYQTGDFHNHTTCSDGTLSLQKLVDKSTNTFGLDWFVQAGHGGSSRRNCTLAEDPFEPVPPALNLDPATTIPPTGQDPKSGKGPNQNWVDTLPNGAAGIKGDVILQDNVRAMWKWQEIQEFIYPVLEQTSRNQKQPIFAGLELNTPGHEHTSSAVIDGQLPDQGNGDASDLAQWEYCFDRSDTDQSRGADNQWDCSVPGSSNAQVDPKAKKINVPSGVGSGTAGHAKTLEGIKWLATFHPETSYFVPAHLERAGAFNPDGNNGFNIEHLRDFNNAAPEIAFGFESMPGHQANSDRGAYTANSVGGGTYGGTGIYAAQVGGVWDALLGEGRHWWFFASSDFHNRGAFGPDQRETSVDFLPGEYTKDYVLVRDQHGKKYGPQQIVDGLRSGNSFVANGGLIDKLSFVACAQKHGARSESKLLRDVQQAIAAAGAVVHIPGCATMGETLIVKPGDDVVVQVALRDPEGTNNSPYSFANPSLKQISLTQPLNQPVLDHVDLIGGDVTGKVEPGSANYAGLINTPAATNPSTNVLATYSGENWTKLPAGWRFFSYRIEDVRAEQYVRLRGTNLPAAVPYETDSVGNPLLDLGAALKIPCADAACPAHMVKNDAGAKTSSLDVAAWSDLWFYSNPIFVSAKK
jgi:hypothetical protein